MAARKTFLLRIDPALWAELERWAAADFRSVNGQIEFILHQAVAKRRGGPPEAGSSVPPSSGGEPDKGSQPTA